MRGEEHRRPGAAILGLQEHVRRRPVRELAGDIASVLVPADDDRPFRRDQAPDSIQGLPEEGGRAEERNVLLGSLITEEPSHQWPQSTTLATRQHDGPGIREPGSGIVRIEERLELKCRGHSAPPFVASRRGQSGRVGILKFDDASIRRPAGYRQ
jgi:hypothetical protein